MCSAKKSAKMVSGHIVASSPGAVRHRPNRGEKPAILDSKWHRPVDIGHLYEEGHSLEKVFDSRTVKSQAM